MSDSSRVRVSVVGVVVMALFSALFARLWFLQVASGSSYKVAAEENTTRVLSQEALRGRILDRNGKVLVDNQVVDVITLDRKLSESERDRVLERLSILLATPVDALRGPLEDPRISPYEPVPVAVGVPEEAVFYVREHPEDFPGVQAEQVTIRRYPNGSLAAHVLGYVGEITAEELESRKGEDYVLGDNVGKAGVELTYEDVLRGTPGRTEIEVDSRGRTGSVVSETEPTPGKDLVLTLDLDVQRVAESALASGMEGVRTQHDPDVKEKFVTFDAPAGSVVVLDADTGDVVAMASNPTYDPSEFVNGIASAAWGELNDPANHFPLNNRALQGQYATGSTFKLMTAIAGVPAVRAPGEYYVDNGYVKVGADQRKFENAGGRAYGPVDLTTALVYSSDTYFYTIGYEFWRQYDNSLEAGTPGAAGLEIQDVARAFGFGQGTGIDLPGEAPGRVPDPAFREELNKDNPDPTSRIWYPGDNVNLAVGQGDFLATPLQLAAAYASYFSGGTKNSPHVAARAVDVEGKVVEEFGPMSSGPVGVGVDPATRAAIDAGLLGAVANGSGTASAAFRGFPFESVPVMGKTGTAEVNGKSNTSVFVAMAGAGGKRYVVTALVEEAGYGASVAAPISRAVIEQLAGLPVTPVGFVSTGVE